MIKYSNDKIPIAFQIDEEDNERISQYRWWYMAGYIYTKERGQLEKLHQFLIGFAPKGLEWDHIDQDQLNNQKNNLRLLTHEQNCHNQKLRISNKSGYPDIMITPNGRYHPRISTPEGRIRLGVYDTLEEAIIIRKEAEKKYWK